METTHFKKLIHLVDYYNHDEYLELRNKFYLTGITKNEKKYFGLGNDDPTNLVSAISKEVINEDFDINIDNFQLELENNINSTERTENKETIFRYYLSEIDLKRQMLNRYEQLKSNTIKNIEDYDTLNDFEKYITKCSCIYFLMINAIYKLCRLCNINYLGLIAELKIKNFFELGKSDIFPNYFANGDAPHPEPIVPEPIDNFGISAKQRFYLLQKTGLLETEMFKGIGISQGAKHKLLAKILSCDVRTAKGMFNNETTYQMSIDNQNEIEKLYNKITKNKDL